MGDKNTTWQMHHGAADEKRTNEVKSSYTPASKVLENVEHKIPRCNNYNFLLGWAGRRSQA